MTTYTKSTNFATKDALLTGNPAKVVKGIEIDAEFTAIQAADATSLKSGDSSTRLTFLQAGTGATSRTVQAKERDIVSVKDFGAVGDGTTNDTAAIQAAIDYCSSVSGGVVYFPAGQYKTTSTLTISTSGVHLEGAGIGATYIFPHQTSGNVIDFLGSVGSMINRVGMRNIAMYGQATDPTSGALVRFANVDQPSLINVDLKAYFGCLHIESARHGYFVGVDAGSDATFTAFADESYIVRISQYTAGIIPSELHFYGAEWRGQNGNGYLEYGLFIQCCDGVWINGGHIGFCRQAAIYVLPGSTTSNVTAINVSNCYLDTVTGGVGASGLLMGMPGGYSGAFGAHNLEFVQIYNCYDGVILSAANTGAYSVTVHQALDINRHAVNITNGDNLRIRLDAAYRINKSNVNGCGVFVNNSNSGYEIYACAYAQDGYTPYVGVWLVGTVDEVNISGRFAGCTYDVLRDSAGAGNVNVCDVVTDKDIQTIAASGGGGLDIPLAQNMILLNTTNNVGSIGAASAAKGRVVHIVAVGSVSVFDSGNLKINGTFSMTADDCLTVVCDGTNWYEVSRSAN